MPSLAVKTRPGARELSDGVGEPANMLARSCRPRLSGQGCPVVMSMPNVIRGKWIKAVSKHVNFMLQHDFALPIVGEGFKVITLGKFG